MPVPVTGSEGMRVLLRVRRTQVYLKRVGMYIHDRSGREHLQPRLSQVFTDVVSLDQAVTRGHAHMRDEVNGAPRVT